MKSLQLITVSLLVAIVSSCGNRENGPGTVTEVVEVTETTPVTADQGRPAIAGELTDEQVQDIVNRSYPYVAMYNVNNKFAIKLGGWNTCDADTRLKDHTMVEIARPNNDSLYISCLLDLRMEPVILEIPAFDSKYVSLMVTGYDHYVNVPLSVTRGDFKKPENVLFYTTRTEGFDGGAVAGVDRNFEMTGDFVSAVFRVMPHASDKARFEKITEQMKQVKVATLSEFLGKPALAIDDIQFPAVGETDSDIYGSNFLQVMQFVVDHTTFDSGNSVDEKFLQAMKLLGIEPGKPPDGKAARAYDPERFRAVADRVRREQFAIAMDPASASENILKLFQPKGQMKAEILLLQSVLGPIGLPASEAIYLPVPTADGEPMNAQYDYVIHMDKDKLPPATAFWSMTLYDSANGFFIPNDRKKYSVGENAGMQLNDDGGIDIYIAADKPEGVPEDNWLPINRQDENLDVILRIYVPDGAGLKDYQVPIAEKLD